LWRIMRKEGVAPRPVTILTLLGRAARYERWPVMFELIDSINEDSVQMTMHDWNSFLWEACKHIRRKGEFTLIEDLLTKMAKTNLKPDAVTYRVLSDMFAEAGKCEEAVKYINIAKKENIDLTAVNYDGVIESYVRSGKFRDVFKILDMMIEDKVSPSIKTYALVVGGLKKAGREDLASEKGRQIVDSGMKEDISIADNQAMVYMQELNVPVLGDELGKIETVKNDI